MTEEANKMADEMIKMEQEQRYWELHGQIKAHGEAAALHLVEFAKALKAMRDEKAYIVAGYDEFAEYTEREFGIGQTQAYSYIQALEGLGEKLMANNAGLGITRLKLLASLPKHIQESFIEENDVGDMSTRALQAEITTLKAKINQQGEQLEMYERNDQQDERTEQLESELGLLREQLAAASEAAAIAQAEASAARGENEADIKKAIDEEVKKKLKAELKAQAKTHELELKRTRETAEQNAKTAADAKQRKLEREKEQAEEARRAALAKAADLEGKLKVAGSPAITRAAVLFEEMQGAIGKMMDAVETVAAENPESGVKLTRAVATVLRNNLAELEGGGGAE